MWYIYKMEYYSASHKKDWNNGIAATQMDPEIIILSLLSLTKTNILYHLYVESNKNYTVVPIYKAETNSQISKPIL